MESFVVKVHTVEGKTYNVRMYMQPGAESQTYKRLPSEVANGVWPDEKPSFQGMPSFGSKSSLASRLNFHLAKIIDELKRVPDSASV
jgi:hypothetical protein